ncbi:MAG: glycosyltransferase [Chlorobiales bacterium]|nr:glycosyltransferase [Chlorobiales bacterium]
MKISYISTFYPLRGGIAHFNALLFQALAGRGHTLRAITFSRQYPKLLFPGKTQDEQGNEDELYKTNAEVLLDSINPLSWIQVGMKVRSFNPDIVLFKYWITFFAPCYFVISLFAKVGRKTRVVYVLDNFHPHEQRPGDKLLLWLATRFVDGYIVMSDKVEQDLKKYFPNPKYEKAPHPIYNIFGDAIPTPEARRNLGLSEQGKVILFFGYIRKYKGLDILLEALPEIVQHHPDLKVLIAGEFYEDEALYRKKIDELNLWPHIILKSDYIPNNEVSRYFCAADCVVLPYRSATQSGIVQIAYHFDRPSIVTNVGGLSEVVLDEKTGYVTREGDAKAIANAVRRFYNEQGQIDFQSNIRKEKEKYSWETFATAVETLCKKFV